MTGIVTIFGGTGFVGRYITRRMAKDGWRIRVVTRDTNDAGFLRPYGAVGQVEPVFGNIRDDATVRAAIRGAHAVINCVGTLDARGKNNFDAVQNEGAARVARIAAQEGVGRLIHISAIGADETSTSDYAKTKALGEAAVLAAFPDAVILRPSVIFGTEDRFFNRFAGMPGPVLPIVGGNTKFQPVWVDDVAAAAVAGADGAAPGVYELGGPDVMTMREMMQVMLREIRRRRLIVNLPFGIARIVGRLSGWAKTLSLGILPQPVTPDQVEALRSDNVVAADARGLSDLGISATDMAAVLPGYLWRFRPSGQYLAIKESARNLKA